MWWNPINSIRHQLNPKTVPSKKHSSIIKKEHKTPKRKHSPTSSASTDSTSTERKQRKQSRTTVSDWKNDPTHVAYWAEGTGGKGSNESWKFNCLCGEMCSSYEDYRYHPVGAMYACTDCGVWSHVVCMLGTTFSLDDLKEMEVRLFH